MGAIDRLDSELLGLLEVNARIGVSELAESLGVTRQTVQSRLARLEKSGFLGGFVPRLNLAMVGIEVEAFVALALDQGELDNIVAGLTSVPEVIEVHATTGREDLLVRVGTESHAALQALIQYIVAMPGVSHSNTTIALTTPLPYRLNPLLVEATKNSGWGRSAPMSGSGPEVA